ncbi:undecaprenyldiphospho-muramoylpentapeptide beta-N-acetylglucosaminyltransferase [Allobacillus halotolerans]|uniref:UDP-N-acetylglucosamine--N-acetylmuramyl-(pentapeptide) pyrophosphoryl-undecaprenol N-acetylglucosamine transferase n=1 Tax=Allobacillus halotolerans TaxID=570278 RepID=A0ABS6GQN6_9BACI|nr:undecaprenyldiphospho-muramoylpentapeptide beta-N-acetylglucosaminyltransferase [Allobacillus halotolerans]MBU6080737.1 undecaprenyldiphospho-muramoylpentapeptide beta-N-acetylglucosaminyltransferase [Allobacillus halotolerans]
MQKGWESVGKQTILFTGGGTAGHVVVNLALIPEFLKEGYDVHYVGSYEGIERELIEGLSGVTYHAISTGKLRRYLSKENIKDPFKVMKGVYQSNRLIKKVKPSIVFSKGGFVSVPVVIASKFQKVPAIIHESDLTPGLANKIASKFARFVLTNFPETVKYLPEEKAKYVGAIIREELFQGSRERAYELTGFTQAKPVLMVMGGSVGSVKMNEAIRGELKTLTEKFQIIHLCGKGNIDSSIHQEGYVQYEYVTDGLKDLLAMSDIVISRAGANSIFEFLALRKPMLLIPLSLQASRGDQLLNAESFEKQGFAAVLQEENLDGERLVNHVNELYHDRFSYKDEMAKFEPRKTKDDVIQLIKETMKK